MAIQMKPSPETLDRLRELWNIAENALAGPVPSTEKLDIAIRKVLTILDILIEEAGG